MHTMHAISEDRLADRQVEAGYLSAPDGERRQIAAEIGRQDGEIE